MAEVTRIVMKGSNGEKYEALHAAIQDAIASTVEQYIDELYVMDIVGVLETVKHELLANNMEYED